MNPVIKTTDMPKELQKEVIERSMYAMEFFNTEIQMAQYLRKYFEGRVRNSVWHCVIGRKFASFVTHEASHYIYFYIGQTAFLLFKSG